MFDKAKVSLQREEQIQLSAFAKEKLQMVERVGHFYTLSSHIAHYDDMLHDHYLMFYLVKGNAILVEHDQYTALESGVTLVRSLEEPCSIFLDDCEVYYAYLLGPDIHAYIREKKILVDARFSKKSEIFFHSVFQSLDKYTIIDEFSISSSLLRLYSDLNIQIHELKQRSDKQEMIDKTLAFMELNYQKDIKLKDLSEASGYSEYYFSRIFKEIMLMTPYEYVLRKRLSQVKILLLSTDKIIEEIALECGFKSDISLYKAFKNVYSITPREYKKTVGK